ACGGPDHKTDQGVKHVAHFRLAQTQPGAHTQCCSLPISFPLPWRVRWAALQWASYCRDDPHSSGYSASSFYLSEHNRSGWRYADSALGESYRSLTNVQLPSWSHAIQVRINNSTSAAN